MRYGPAYRGARMQGRSNVFPGHAFDRHNGAPTIKLRTRKLLNVGVYPYSREGIERWFFSINSRLGLAYPFEERSSRGLRQHSGVSTRFRCENYKLNKMGSSLCEPVTNDLSGHEQKRSQETQKHALRREKWRRSLFTQSVAGKTSESRENVVIHDRKINCAFKIQRKGVDGARRSRGFTLFQHGAPSCRVIASVMSAVDNSSSPQDKSDTLFHIKPDFLVEYVALLVGLGFPHLSRSRRLLDTSDFTQYIDRYSKPARPVRSQSFISFSLRSGSLVL
ncbi:hypothetical protein ALC57_16514 [Trachymyrmex cornetzi]|uniref:Uncharacterized protein n=1 Tax=Trachymyrmex cornetzi TaxID=471704 RepID=A0A195DEI2_9HYME|nr:hypothetical protein ALC57_16514 [Trachymyrmex cornetzi]